MWLIIPAPKKSCASGSLAVRKRYARPGDVIIGVVKDALPPSAARKARGPSG